MARVAVDTVPMRAVFLPAAVLALAIVSPATAATLRVPDSYPTIQEAVDAAQSGDVVKIAKGTFAPFAVLLPLMSRHLPRALTVGPGVTVHRCPAAPEHDEICTCVPSAVLPLRTSRHLPAMPTIGPGPPVGSVNASTSKRGPAPPAKVR